MGEVREWITPDETAKTFFARIATDRPRLLHAPLHRLPLRPGNILEITGPSPSAKTLILIHVAIDCILPKEWKGVSYGGLEQTVMFIDLDCRFDVSRLTSLLKYRISTCDGSKMHVENEQEDPMDWRCDEDLITNCLERFLYVHCYDTLEFLATLKTLTYQLRINMEPASLVRLIMIDSIGAYYWVDRASTSLPLGCNNRKMVSLQSMTEAIVREIQNFQMIHPVIVIATKATIFGDKSGANDVRRPFKKWSPQDTSGETTVDRGPDNILHREYMPSAWQSFVTHRISIQPSRLGLPSGKYDSAHEQVYAVQWLLPSMGCKDKFVIRNDGLCMIP